MPTTPPMGLRQILPGTGFSFGVDGGASSGVQEVVPNTIGTACMQTSFLQLATVNLTAANITGMYATPVQIIAAAPTGQSVVVDSFVFRFQAGSTAFTSGGAVQLQIGNTNHAGGTAVGNTIAASVVTSASSSDSFTNVGSSLLTLTQATGIYITNATGAFATGNGTAIVFVWYTIN
jgi:hypothetical protein